MPLVLFDNINRDDTGPASYSEPKFGYLNRSGRPTFLAIRPVLEDWFSRYPEPHRNDLRGRFRSSDNTQHRSAFFELFIHELLLRLDCRVKIHPTLAGVTTSPDFLVDSRTNGEFYVEAAVASGEPHEKASARAIRSKLYDILNRLDSPNFFVGCEFRNGTQTPPPARKVKAFLKQKLSALDPERIARDLQSCGFEALPHWLYSQDGWIIEFFPIPKSPLLRGKPGVRPIGMESDGGGLVCVDDRTPLRDAILDKASKYGELDLPFVVAVNSLAEHLDRIDALEALFGREQFVYTQTPTGLVGPKAQRAPDGVWTSPGGPRYTRLSAVLLIHALFPWNIPRCSICLYHNPFAEKGLDCELNRLPRMVPQGDRPEWVAGQTLSSILGLPEDWPGRD